MSYDGTDQIPGFGDQSQMPGPGQAGPVAQSTATPRQLVRDPYTRLGGVASGLGHYLGVDVSIVRLGFVLFTLFSGVGLIIYLLAWLVVPRAEYWPPVGTARPLRTITAREVGIGIAILGGLLFLFFNGGGTARVLVPILLITGGIWLLRQAEASPASTGGSIAPPPPPPPYQSSPSSYPAPDERTRVFESTDPTMVGNPFSSASAPQPADTMAPPPPPPPTLPPATGDRSPGTPVPPRRRRWRRVLIPLFILFILIPLLLIALAIGLLIGNGVDFDGGFEAQYRPTTIEAIPLTIEQDAGQIVLDLTDIDFAAELDPVPVPPLPELDGPALANPPAVPEVPPVPELPELPVPIAIEMDFGEIRVIVPDDLAIEVDAEAIVGEVQVFDRFEEGIRNDVTHDADEPVIELEIRLGAGDVVVERG